MSEQEAYARMVALWDRQRKGETVSAAEVRHAENAWVHEVRKRVPPTTKAKQSYHAGGKR